MAFFGAMTFGLSPLFIPQAVSFMTDSYWWFFLAAIYAGVRWVIETKSSGAVALFSLAMLLSFVGGMNRQAVWVTGPAIAAAYCFSRREHYRNVLFGILALLIFLTGCGLVLGWLKRQPDFQYVMMSGQALTFTRAQVVSAVHEYSGLLLITIVLAIPVLYSGVALVRRTRETLLALLAAVCGLTAA